jgi:hypothetical protein
MLYAAMNVTRIPLKATNLGGIKNGKSSHEIRLSWYQSIDMYCIVFVVKFDGWLYILVLRNKQLFTKNWGSKPISVKK